MKVSKLTAIAAVGLLTLSACSEDQSRFDVQDVPGRCLIEGVITYNEGTTFEDGHFVHSFKPAAELEVTVTIENSEYGDLQGESTFTTVTDAEGKYAIEIPAPAKDAFVTIRTADFRGTRTYVERVNNEVVTKTQDVIYRGGTEVENIHSQGIVYANFNCYVCNANTPQDEMNQYALLNGKIGQGIEYKIPAERKYNEDDKFIGYKNAEVKYVFTGAKVDMIVKVNYQNVDYTYNVTSDSNGEWSLQVPVYGFPADFTYTIEAMPYDSSYARLVPEERPYKLNADDEEELTYIDYVTENLTGYYSQYFTASYSSSFPVSAVVGKSESKIMVFNPFNNGQDTFGYSSYEYGTETPWLDELLESLENNK